MSYNNKGEEVHNGITPFTVDLKRVQGYFMPAKYTIKAEYAGLARELGTKSGMNPWYFGNIVFGGLLGMVVIDPITGAMWDPQSNVNIDFGSATNPEPGNKTSTYAPSNSPQQATTPR